MPTMQKPTTEEVATYAATLNYQPFDADAFVDHWDMRGWLVRPGIPMRDWKAAVRTWQRNAVRWSKEKAAAAGSAPLLTPAEESAVSDYSKLAAHIMCHQQGYQIDRLYSKVRNAMGQTALEEVKRRARLARQKHQQQQGNP